MSGKTSIEWTDVTWNPVRGCSRVSEGCRHCYAERQAARFVQPGQPFHGFAKVTAPRDVLDRVGGRRNGWTGRVELTPSKLEEPLHWKTPRRVFVNSMSDLFHESLSDEAIAAVFGVMAACPHLTFQVLTKRPERMRRWFEWMAEHSIFGIDRARYCAKLAHNSMSTIEVNRTLLRLWDGSEVAPPWPLPHVWIGVSVEDQATADARIPLLLQTPAALRFVSYEPALGPVDFVRGGWTFLEPLIPPPGNRNGWKRGIDWLIVGGESGRGRREMDPAWVESVHLQTLAAGVALFVKQDSGPRPGMRGRLLDHLWARKEVPDARP